MILVFIFGVVTTLFPLCVMTHRKNTQPKNKVHFYVARDKFGNLWFYMGKPFRGDTEFYADSKRRVFYLTYNIERFGLKHEDFDYLKWEDEPVEVFLNMED